MNKPKGLPKVVRFDFNKHLPQSSAEKTNDLFFVLSAMYIANREEEELTRLTLEKTLFKTSQILSERNFSFFNTFFFINTLGPHNNIFYKYMEELERAGLIEVEERAVYLTAKGLRAISEILEKISPNPELQEVLVTLEQKIEEYSKDPDFAIEETHSQKVVDTTDGNKVKTIRQLIREIEPEQQFKTSAQFKYIEPVSEKKIKKIQLPSEFINELESTLASVEPQDFEQDSEINYLFK